MLRELADNLTVPLISIFEVFRKLMFPVAVRNTVSLKLDTMLITAVLSTSTFAVLNVKFDLLDAIVNTAESVHTRSKVKFIIELDVTG